MGVVYSPEAVRDGKVPGPGAQAQAGKYLLDSLFKGNFENGIVAGMIYGSTAYGRATVRSDLDLLVLHDNALARIATDALRRQIVNVRDQFHVVVEPHISAAGHHTSLVDPLYEKHLEDVANQAREWTRNDPIPHMRIIKATEKAVRRDATLYAKRKSVRFATISATAGERVDLVNLQRAFELPGSIGRKVTALYGMEKEGAALTDRPTLAGTALECLVAAGETSLTESGVEAHTKLVELDATYTDLLKRTMKDGDVAEYAQWLKDAYLTACQDAHVLAGAWLEALYPDYPGDS